MKKHIKIVSTIVLASLFITSGYTVGYQKAKAEAIDMAVRDSPIRLNSLELRNISVAYSKFLGVTEKKKKEKQVIKKEIHFNPNNVTEISNATAEQIDSVLKGTKLYGLGEAYIRVEKKNNINALFLIGLSANESAWGRSRLAKEKNNITSFSAYDHDAYNEGRTFKTKEECILITAKWLSEKYLNPNGKYYNGLGVKDINIKYARDKEWHIKVSSIAKKLKSKL